MNEVSISRLVVSEAKRLSFFPKHCGHSYLLVEQACYDFANVLSDDYQGGYWDFFECSNGAFYMAPVSSVDRQYHVSVSGNYFDGELSADAFGIVVCLFSLGRAADGSNGLAEKYHALLDYAREHSEADLIRQAID